MQCIKVIVFVWAFRSLCSGSSLLAPADSSGLQLARLVFPCTSPTKDTSCAVLAARILQLDLAAMATPCVPQQL